MAKSSAQAPTSTEKNIFARFAQYVEDSRMELRKVTWPTLKDTRKATLAVVGFSAIMAVVLGLIDLGLSALVQSILS
ncbi:preprotein translocase subunit SecE [Desulfovibrio piger]|nr:preprotein translocase subunit SecE [Desulfovibrio piger]